MSSVANTITDEPAAAPAVSVVVCSHNGAQTIAGVLTSLRRQTLADHRHEVLVVDDGSTDGTAGVAKAEGVRVVRLEPSVGLAAARNAGVHAARAELIAFTDDDCEADFQWLEAILAALSDPEVAGAGGRVVPRCANRFLLGYFEAHNPLTPLGAELLDARLSRRLALYLRRTFFGEPEPSAGEQLYSVVGANMAFRRSVLERLGGFDEAFSFGGEEEDLCRRAQAEPEPVSLRYLPAARVEHWFDASVFSVLRRARSYGRGNARAALKHLEVRPIVYPFPLALGGLVVRGLLTRRQRVVAGAALLPLAAYPSWVTAAKRSGSAQPLAYPFIELAREIFTMIGELEGWRVGCQRRW